MLVHYAAADLIVFVRRTEKCMPYLIFFVVLYVALAVFTENFSFVVKIA